MTPFNAALTAFELTAAIPLIVGALTKTRPPQVPEPPRPANPPAVVVHEAGHALLAWHCTAVAEVLSIDTVKSGNGTPGGHVRCSWLMAAPQPALDWCRLVVALGGVAAEVMIIGIANSWNASDDLLSAVALCRSIVRTGSTEPPWPTPSKQSISFERALPDLSEEELRVMRAAYATARDLLGRRSRSLARLVVLLFHKSYARTEDLAHALRARPVASTSLWRSLSGEVKAEFSVRGRTL